MKKWFAILLAAGVLCGCGAQQTFETVNDDHVISAAAPAKQLVLDLPKEAAKPVMESESGGSLYLCDGYTLTVQTLAGGDLDRTLRQTTGFSGDALQMMKTKDGALVRYETVWSAAGETGDQVGRAVILDDGVTHYAVSVMADAADAGDLMKTWQTLFDSVSVSTG